MRRSLAMVIVLFLAGVGLVVQMPLAASLAAPAARGRDVSSVQVSITNFAFNPKTLTVPVGTTVTWTNRDSVAHTVSSNTNAWSDSGALNQNQTFSYTFTKPGAYAYHCAYHPYMTATITVTAAGSSNGGSQAGSHPQAGTALVKLASAKILVTPAGMTLYVFAKDPANKSMCTGTCAKYWPPYLVAKGTTPTASMTGIPGTFGVVARTDGTQQLTYDGAPLYTFLGDKKAGDMNGQGSTASGGYWWVVVAAGK